MGLLENLLIGIIHLAFVAMDVLIIMIMLRQIHERWRPNFLKPIVTAFEPALEFIVDYAKGWTTGITGQTYSYKTVLVMIVVILAVLRLVIVCIAG